MNYLLDKKTKRNRILKIIFGVIIFISLFYFRVSIFDGLSYISANIFRPVLTSGNSVGAQVKSLGAYFVSKNSLYRENENLKARIDADVADRANYNSVVAENASLKEILGRKNESVSMTLAAILAKPNQSPYDTIIVDVGIEQGIKVGDKVFALGNVPIGYVAQVYPNTSKVILYSNSGEKTQVVVSGKPASPDASQGGNVSMEIVGRGGGNFEMILPRDFVLLKGDQAVLPGLTPHVLGIVETILSDPRDSFQKALLVSPVNIQEIKFVEVET